MTFKAIITRLALYYLHIIDIILQFIYKHNKGTLS